MLGGVSLSLVTTLSCVSLTISSASAASSNEPINQQQAINAVKTWFADTNRAWTLNDFSKVDLVTTGVARAAYGTDIHALAKRGYTKAVKPFTLTDLTVVVPCQSGPTKTFVAYANTGSTRVSVDHFATGSTRSVGSSIVIPPQQR